MDGKRVKEVRRRIPPAIVPTTEVIVDDPPDEVGQEGAQLLLYLQRFHGKEAYMTDVEHNGLGGHFTLEVGSRRLTMRHCAYL